MRALESRGGLVLDEHLPTDRSRDHDCADEDDGEVTFSRRREGVVGNAPPTVEIPSARLRLDKRQQASKLQRHTKLESVAFD